MIIREAEEYDIPDIKMIIDRNFNEIMSKEHSKNVICKFLKHNTEESLKQQLCWKKIYVAVDNNNVIGTGAFVNFSFEQNNPRYSISNLYVLPEFQRNGIGIKLMKKLVRDFEMTDAATFHVPSSRGAVSFYKKLGFKIDEIQSDLEDEITWMTYTK